ncbi:hypothetical protein EPA93_45925 [Ktedonosporobacter rubrisoli]|uniref:Lanthionine synthetase n=1 Tax=Ktedonosporobacter rubrisoli TaxID=2509675 RepID=A0A4P6K4D5_KTERU|nr:lanthionine synthetase C family protein [Ktedonosporobacter rubrisoli]QBD82915.1 hypothetical protein EPA93_45925 [Ktedonosporobacter rubrisoli]
MHLPGERQSSSWQVMLRPELAISALAIAKHIAKRLRDPEVVLTANEQLKYQTPYAQYYLAPDDSCYSGRAGLALLCAQLAAVFPEDEWDVVAHQHLQAVTSMLSTRPTTYFRTGASSLCSLLFVILLLSRNGTRYQRLLSTLEAQTLPEVRALAQHILAERTHGCHASVYDHLHGLAGMGTYLLCRCHIPAVAETLQTVLSALIYLTEEKDGIPHWFTPFEHIDAEILKKKYPEGYLNCGFAHGIPGLLALLSIARSCKVEVPGLENGIRRAADWLIQHRMTDAWGINWPAVFPLGKSFSPIGGSRTAWCYGIPGVARALWLAGQALDYAPYREAALEGMYSVYRQPDTTRQIEPAGFCHGLAGLLHITLRFASETQDERFVEVANTLCEQFVANYQPEALFGYRALGTGRYPMDLPGLLYGAAGNVLVLLASATSHEPIWDRLFLLT